MDTPLEFLDLFRRELRSTGIAFAITSGMACVRYGLQQTTKDSDWPWPASEPLAAQHERLVTAARSHGLPATPLAGAVRHAVYEAAFADAVVLTNMNADRLATIAPPIEEVLP